MIRSAFAVLAFALPVAAQPPRDMLYLLPQCTLPARPVATVPTPVRYVPCGVVGTCGPNGCPAGVCATPGACGLGGCVGGACGVPSYAPRTASVYYPTYAPSFGPPVASPIYAAPMGLGPSMGFGGRSCGPGGCR